MKKVSILNLNKHIEKKTVFLVFVQSPAVSLLLVLSCLLVMAEGTFFYRLLNSRLSAVSYFSLQSYCKRNPSTQAAIKEGLSPRRKNKKSSFLVWS